MATLMLIKYCAVGQMGFRDMRTYSILRSMEAESKDHTQVQNNFARYEDIHRVQNHEDKWP
jgi:hypothetical protein